MAALSIKWTKQAIDSPSYFKTAFSNSGNMSFMAAAARSISRLIP
jgi:hypothetical protein